MTSVTYVSPEGFEPSIVLLVFIVLMGVILLLVFLKVPRDEYNLNFLKKSLHRESMAKRLINSPNHYEQWEDYLIHFCEASIWA
jgi:hypothetical protein